MDGTRAFEKPSRKHGGTCSPSITVPFELVYTSPYTYSPLARSARGSVAMRASFLEKFGLAPTTEPPWKAVTLEFPLAPPEETVQ
jgi:hypothetical protein